MDSLVNCGPGGKAAGPKLIGSNFSWWDPRSWNEKGRSILRAARLASDQRKPPEFSRHLWLKGGRFPAYSRAGQRGPEKAFWSSIRQGPVRFPPACLPPKEKDLVFRDVIIPITPHPDPVENHFGQGCFAALPGAWNKKHLIILFQVRENEGLKISGNRHVHNIRLYCKVANDKFRVLSKNVFPEKTFSPTEAEILYSHCRAPNILSAPENSDLSSKNAYYWDPFHWVSIC